jgi:ferredoxin
MCEGCVEACPEVFQVSEEFGYIEVAELDEYPEECVQEAINCCPTGCISWEEG